MRPGRCKYTQPIYLKAERGLRAAASDIARSQGLSLAELIRTHLRQIVASADASRPEARS